MWRTASSAARSRHGNERTTNQHPPTAGHMMDRSRPLDGRAVIRVEAPGSDMQTRRAQRRCRSSDRLSRDGSRCSPVGLQVAIRREPEVCIHQIAITPFYATKCCHLVSLPAPMQQRSSS